MIKHAKGGEVEEERSASAAALARTADLGFTKQKCIQIIGETGTCGMRRG